MSKFIQCKHRYGKRWPETEKLDADGKVVLGKDGKPIRLPEVFLPEAEKNMVIMISDAQIENLEQSSIFRDLMAKGDYVYHDKMPESAKNDSIRLMERDAELDAAKQKIAQLESQVASLSTPTPSAKLDAAKQTQDARNDEDDGGPFDPVARKVQVLALPGRERQQLAGDLGIALMPGMTKEQLADAIVAKEAPADGSKGEGA